MSTCLLPVATMKRGGWRRLRAQPVFSPCGRPATWRVTLHGEPSDLCDEHSRQYREELPWTDLATNPEKLKVEAL